MEAPFFTALLFLRQIQLTATNPIMAIQQAINQE